LAKIIQSKYKLIQIQIQSGLIDGIFSYQKYQFLIIGRPLENFGIFHDHSVCFVCSYLVYVLSGWYVLDWFCMFWIGFVCFGLVLYVLDWCGVFSTYFGTLYEGKSGNPGWWSHGSLHFEDCRFVSVH
jgi:hypothetical protein